MNCSGKFLVAIQCFTYNHENYIEDCLNGFVIQKTNFNFVAIVHDDASTDNTADIIRKYEKKYPNIIHGIYETENQYSKGNVILNRIMNDACIATGAKYIAICEGDDFWTDPLKLQKQVDYMELHDNYSMCCTAFTQTFDYNESSRSEVLLDIDEITIDNILLGLWIGTLTVVFRKDLILDFTPPFEDLPFGDLPMWCHFAMRGKIKYIKDITANYRSLSESACHSKDLKKQVMFDLSVMRVIEYYAQKSGKIDLIKNRLATISHCCFEESYSNQWFDFPIKSLWHFVKVYGTPTGYDRIRKWGLGSIFKYRLAKFIILLLKGA